MLAQQLRLDRVGGGFSDSACVLELALALTLFQALMLSFFGCFFFLNALVFGAVGTATGKWNEVT